jgi:hypothetical protein
MSKLVDQVASQRLTSKQVARFVADGFIKFEAIVPPELNARALAQIESNSGGVEDHGYRGERFADRYRGTALAELFRLPQVEGIIRSLVGPDPIFDHHCPHLQHPNSGAGAWHQDAVIDAKRHFDLQLMYFPQDTPREMGGTMLLPGSHFRRINVFEPGRYHNFVGQAPTVCPAGTIVATHHGIWHCAQANRTATKRYMFKVRLAASVPQVKLFDTADLHDPEVGRILGGGELFWAGTDSRLEVIHRAQLWRLLTDNPGFDIQYYLGRIENDPFREVPRAARGWRSERQPATAG